MFMPTLIVTLTFPTLTGLQLDELLPHGNPIVIRERESATRSRSPYQVRPGPRARYASPYVPAAPNIPAPATGSPYPSIQHPAFAAPRECPPPPQILEAPPRWLPGCPASRTNKRQAPQPPHCIPMPMPLIPLDQVPES